MSEKKKHSLTTIEAQNANHNICALQNDAHVKNKEILNLNTHDMQ